MVIKIIFWLFVTTLLYTYLGYTLLLAIFSAFSKKSSKNKQANNNLPHITFLIAAYNEREIALEKVKNTFKVDYPKENIHQLWVTDGSTDGTNEVLKGIENVEVLHNPIRKGKTAAINRGMSYVKTPITFFSDANSSISSESAKLLISLFDDPKVGCVAGEKRIQFEKSDNAVSSGEGVYWKYESFIKKLESNCGSTLSAAGELYAIRTELFKPIENDVILDDFVISTNIAKEGYKIKYVPEAYAVEKASVSINEEKKRKIRIAAGGFQTLFRYTNLLNTFKYPTIAIQYISHKVLRWIIVPFLLFLLPILNVLIIMNYSNHIYFISLYCLIFFWGLAFLGWLLQNSRIRIKSIFLPYYLIVMNLSIIQGFWMYLNGRHKVAWEKSIRQT